MQFEEILDCIDIGNVRTYDEQVINIYQSGKKIEPACLIKRQ